MCITFLLSTDGGRPLVRYLALDVKTSIHDHDDTLAPDHAPTKASFFGRWCKWLMCRAALIGLFFVLVIRPTESLFQQHWHPIPVYLQVKTYTLGAVERGLHIGNKLHMLENRAGFVGHERMACLARVPHSFLDEQQFKRQFPVSPIIHGGYYYSACPSECFLMDVHPIDPLPLYVLCVGFLSKACTVMGVYLGLECLEASLVWFYFTLLSRHSVHSRSL